MSIAPTEFVKQGEKVNLKKLMWQKNWSKALIRPVEGKSSEDCYPLENIPEHLTKAQAFCEKLLKTQDVLIQPFLDNVLSIGEFSAIFIGWEFSHSF